MWLRASCEMTFEISAPTPFILMLRPRSGALQWIAREEYRIRPIVAVHEFTDNYGNLCQRLVAPTGNFSIFTAAEVKTVDRLDEKPGAPFNNIETLPDQVLVYLLPSRFCESDQFSDMAAEITEGYLLGYDQVKAIEIWLRDNVKYIPGSGTASSSAIDVNEQGFGVCRDLAHLGIALCRGISIPARMVVGYLHGLQPMDLHAWFEAFVGDRWYTFDATQVGEKSGYICTGYGRDAADVAIYNQFGPTAILTEQIVTVTSLPQIGYSLPRDSGSS